MCLWHKDSTGAQRISQSAKTAVEWHKEGDYLLRKSSQREARAVGIEAASLARNSGDKETCTEVKKLVGHAEIEWGKIMAKQKAK